MTGCKFRRNKTGNATNVVTRSSWYAQVYVSSTLDDETPEVSTDQTRSIRGRGFDEAFNTVAVKNTLSQTDSIKDRFCATEATTAEIPSLRPRRQNEQ